MKKERRPDSFLPKPVYPGGSKAMSMFIRDNLNYPKEAKKNEIEGTVRIRIKIDYKGTVIDVKIISGLGYGCDEEATRLAKLLKFKSSSKLRKIKVTFGKTLNINFRLPQKIKTDKQEKSKFNYTIVAPSTSSNSDSVPNSVPYVYKINL